MSISQNFVNLRPSLLLDFANTEQLDPRITFSRPTTAAYYDANTTALAEQNLFTYSQLFSNAIWTVNTSIITATSGITAPDGTSTAFVINEGTATNNHNIPYSVGFNAGTYTSSIYVQNVTGRYFTMTCTYAGASYASVVFDLSTGAVVNSSAISGFTLLGSSITAVGSWYRCAITFTSTNATSNILNFSLNNSSAISTYGLNSYTGTSNTLNIWGAQLEQRSTVTAYNATTTTAITNYIPVLLTAPTNQARFDHDPVARTSLGLLIEQQSTNLLTYSSAFDNAVWTKTNCSVTTTADVSPDGTQNAQKIIPASSSASFAITTPITTLGTLTSSIYLKAAEITSVAIFNYNGADGDRYAVFNLSTGAVTGSYGSTYSITPVGNGWYRCSMTVTSTSLSGATLNIVRNTYSGNGFNGFFAWGAQLEALAFPTSYIPTVASQVTRSADSASMTGTNFSSWYNPAGGTVYSEFILRNTAAFQPSFSINSGTNANEVILGGLTTTGYYVVYANGTVQFNANPTVGAINTTTKASMSFLNNTVFGASFNGAAATNSASSLITAQNVNILLIGNETQQRKMNGTIKKLMFYPVAATNTQLQSLTGS